MKEQEIRLPSLLALSIGAATLKNHINDSCYDEKDRKAMQAAIDDLEEQYKFQGENGLFEKTFKYIGREYIINLDENIVRNIRDGFKRPNGES